MRRAAENCIGLDVGGTRIRAARILRNGQRAGHLVEPVCADRAGFAAQVLRLIGSVRDDGSRAAGIGIPGRVDGTSGTILSAGYVAAAGLDLRGLIAREAGLPARIENDAAMALMAEGHARRDEAQGIGGLIAMVTVGTGIGGALIQNGAPWHGGGIAGQFGHLVVAAHGSPCKCGRRGCVETFSSGTALGGLIARVGLPADTRAEDLLDAADAGDSRAAAVLADWAAPFRRALETLVAAVDPQRLIVGGGLGAQMVRALARLDAPGGWFALPVEAARLGDDAGVIGAGLAAFAMLDAPA